MTTTTLDRARTSGPSFSAIAIFAYGVTCYALGVSGLVYMILVTLGIVPFGLGALGITSMPLAVALNVGLVGLFGVQHAVMARPAFKERWTKIIHPAAERATFTLLAGLLIALALWLWQPVGGMLWSAEAPALRWTLLGGCAFGWCYLLASTFAIDHFELFGLRQVWRNLRGDNTAPPAFVERLMYRFDRHPIMTGALMGLWLTPDVSVDRLLLAGAFTSYMVIGVTLEERDLVARHGERYLSYARRVGTIVPRLVRLARG